jgi:hypothetical protein
VIAALAYRRCWRASDHDAPRTARGRRSRAFQPPLAPPPPQAIHR